jgi:hypothetical protein
MNYLSILLFLNPVIQFKEKTTYYHLVDSSAAGLLVPGVSSPQ